MVIKMTEHETELSSLLETMDIPILRRDISKPENLLWLSRNLVIRNGTHPDFNRANTLIKILLRKHVNGIH